jgi:hypothetical protein
VLPVLRDRGLWRHPAAGVSDGTLNAAPFTPTSGPAAPSAGRPRHPAPAS